MTPQETIQALLNPQRQPGEAAAQYAEDLARKLARVTWIKEMEVKFRDTQRECDERCMEAVDRLSEDDFNALFEAEEAKVNAIRDALVAVAEHDKWPRHLHWPL
ncbi:MAG: hypothetical protein ABIQ32_09550 [Sphingomicrobium sp.]